MIATGQGVQALCLFLHLTREALGTHIVRLGRAMPHDRPIRKGGANAWSIADKTLAIFLRLSGVHPDVIGQMLSKPRSGNAVRAQARRLGVPCPSRSDLFRPDPSSLRALDAAMIARVMRSRGDFAETARLLRHLLLKDSSRPPEVAAKPAHHGRTGRIIRSEGQRELPLMGVVAGRDKDEAKPEVETPVAATPVPAKEELVDFNDLTWFRSLIGKNPLTNRVAVYVAGMLILGGLHYKAAAKRLGLSDASFRTFRTRMDIPVDADRSKAGTAFDEEAAKLTLLRSGYELRLCMRTQKNWFWVKKTDRGVRNSPPCRIKERFVGERSNKIQILTRAMLNSDQDSCPAPFAKFSARICA
jgi:hypothetical protein